MAGASTELYSEVLAQVCLAYSIKNNSALTKDILIKGGKLDPKIIKDIERYMITQSSVNLSSPMFADGFVKYISGNVSGKLNWIDAQGRNMQEVKKRFKIGNQHKVFNDKLFDSTASSNNPYTAFLKAGTGAKTDKWNPADIWVMNLDGIRALNRLNKSCLLYTSPSPRDS